MGGGEPKDITKLLKTENQKVWPFFTKAMEENEENSSIRHHCAWKINCLEAIDN